MYKVIVVEDDRIIRRGICQAIPWEEHGLVIAGEAGDGEMALELIEKEQPQVVISDINMPFMTGLEMGKKIKEISPRTRIIFLTGYEDFKYAHEAVKLKAFDYQLKPVDSGHLLEKAKEAAEDWALERKKEERISESLPFLQQRFFQKLMFEPGQKIDVEKELQELGVTLAGSCFAAVLVHLSSGDGNSSEEILGGIHEVCSSSFPQENYFVLNMAEDQYAALLSFESEDEAGKGEFAQHLIEHFQKERGSSMTVTFGRTYPNLFELGKSLLEARLAMDLRHIIGTGTVITFEDTVSTQDTSKTLLQDIELELENQIKLGLPEKAKGTLSQLKQVIMESKNVPLADLKVLALKFSTMLFFEAEKWKKEELRSFDSSDVYKDIMKMETLPEMVEILSRLTEQWSEVMHKKEDKSQFSHVDEAIKYINENYHDNSLTLQKVAEFIHVSTPYLSNLFKLEKGFNFGDYLLELRMKKAMDSFRDGEKKTYEVSEAVGYNNPQYFSICFKKYTGYTPAEYKKQFK